MGRPILNLVGSFNPLPGFSHDGRIGVYDGDSLTTYQVDPALEYKSFVHPSSQPIAYRRASVHQDGRLLALGTSRGAALWDLARGVELAFLPIGEAAHLMFEPSGDLLTSGSAGVQRWPVQLDPAWGQFRIGPPRRLPLPPSGGGIAEDRSGRIVALARHDYAHLATAGRTTRVGPLDDCRCVAISPDGRWLVTGSHRSGARIWRLEDATEVATLSNEGSTEVHFSPDGQWLMTEAPCRLWAVGSWREARRIGGYGHGFSPDGRLLVVQDANLVLRLVETETGRTLARLESPDQCGVIWATFSPDGSRLVVTTQDGPAVHVWDLRAIRRNLGAMALDWDAPAYPRDDPADPSAPPLPSLQVDLGALAGHTEQFTETPETLVERHTGRLKEHPDDAEALHQRGHALRSLRRHDEALADFTAALALRPDDPHLRAYRGICLLDLKRYWPALEEFERVLRADPNTLRAIGNFAVVCNNRAWLLANAPVSERAPEAAVRLARLAVALVPEESICLNTLGVAQYRAGSDKEAVATLEKSLAAGKGRSDASDLFFLAMARHRLGQPARARADFDRAVSWCREHPQERPEQAQELKAFQAEAEAVLAGPVGELPVDVFAPDRGEPVRRPEPSR
jgi:tetratricopeptide (TPR) repeat protein